MSTLTKTERLRDRALFQDGQRESSADLDLFIKSRKLGSILDASSVAGRRLAAMLAAVLLLAVWLEGEHMADVAAHDGSVCEVCLFAGSSGHGVAPSPAPMQPAFASGSILAVAEAALPSSFLLRRVQSPRAPPFVS